jgi:transcriptional regulator with XRE-family HTH domain
MSKIFSERIRKLRQDKELSQAKLATILKTHQQTIDRWEHGKLQPDLETLIALANLFDVTIDYLVGTSNDIIKPGKPPRNDLSGAYDDPTSPRVKKTTVHGDR